ncbi:hypothetical protein DH2020_039965 [Rehmannia glutinosa]|uniref:Endonuclease/exonuclease/phosphatase domain-containing protein n=1 Tax=Rehmannia glutinosa TaxID=99300 RepID=A0ABR0UUF0_REHGL
MNLLGWNCRGLGNLEQFKSFASLLAKVSHSIFLCETKCAQSIIDKLKSDLGYHGIVVDSVGRAGGLALLWRKNIQVSLRIFSTRFIDVDVSYQNSTFRVTVSTGSQDVSQRWNFWNLFKHLKTHSFTPWLCLGDFNEVLLQSEFHGRGLRVEWQIQNFREALQHCALSDMGYSGSQFTWHRLLTHPYTQKARLDRCVGNDALRSLFPRHMIEHLNSISSDHHAIFVTLHHTHSQPQRSRRKNPFRFEAYWIKSKDCEKVIQESWNSSLDSLNDKIQNCSIGLLHWSRKSVGDLDKKIKEIKKCIEKLQQGRITEDVNTRIHELKMLYDLLLEQNNLKWKQRAKQHWYKEGDRNTNFFHNFAGQTS